VSEERRRVLAMLAAGRIGVEEAEALLDALEEARPAAPSERFLRVSVRSEDGDRLEFRLPLALARAALSLLPDQARARVRAHGVDLEALLSGPAGLPSGKLVDLHDEDGNDVVIEVVGP